MKLSQFGIVQYEQHPSGCWHGIAYNSGSDLTPKIAVRCFPTKELAKKALEACAKVL